MRPLAPFTVALLAALAGSCAPATRGGGVRLERGARAEVVESRAQTADRTVQLDRARAKSLTVKTSYGGLGRNVARVSVVAGLAVLGLLLGAAGAPSPPDTRLTLGLYLAAAASFTAALVTAWRFFL